MGGQYTKIILILWCCIYWIGCTPSAKEATNETAADSTSQVEPQATSEAVSPAIPERNALPPLPKVPGQKVHTGAERLVSQASELLAGKRIGIVANHTSRLPQGAHLVDTLLGLGIEIVAVFSPEHGFRGDADAGAKVASGKDERTGLPIISLYGKNRKPQQAQLEGIDVMLFDLQDVGSRHYTYISTLTYVMEACGEASIPVMVLDRPNPNGWYVDGPMMEAAFTSFIGMHTVPIVHGMTVGEYARMILGEKWITDPLPELEVVEAEGYRHEMKWEETGLEWIPPSPNLGTAYAAYLYPGLCWLEPTPVSVGRGTHDAFTLVGAPWLRFATEAATARTVEGTHRELYGLTLIPNNFIPVSLPGKSTHPKFQDKMCKGIKFEGVVSGRNLFLAGITLMQQVYQDAEAAGKGSGFFYKGFEKWSGYGGFRQQITDGIPAEEIYDSWQDEVTAYRSIRAKYLIYD